MWKGVGIILISEGIITISKEAIRFIIVGIINTFFYYILYLVFITGWHYVVAHVLSFLISMVGSFFLHTYFTYRTQPTLMKFIQFPVTNVVNILISTGGMYFLVELFKVNEKIAPLLATFIAIPFTFLMSRHILREKHTH
ncbi:GtrA family protein [Bacillus sp. HMF5848]|nr:GtrA family protein [Bacillus sp. HMF5848]